MLDRLFIQQENVPQEQRNGIAHLVKTLYGDRLEHFVKNIIGKGKDTLYQKYIYLMVLNNERSLQRYLLKNHPQYKDKLNLFFVYLKEYTEDLFNHKKTIDEFMDACRDAWILA